MDKNVLMKNRSFIIVLTIIAIVGIGLSVFFYFQYRNALNNPVVAGQLESQDLVKKISRLILLPQNEVPTVATVSDISKLKTQPFFHNSQNGDKLLIYTRARVAILYNPQADKVINVAPLNIGQGQSQASSGATPIPMRIAIYNGTKVAGLTNTIEQQLKAKISNASFSVKQNAKNIYSKTIVVDLSGNQQQAATDLAKLVNGAVAPLPNGEVTPANSDLLVILGK
jgi:LytR cell envelope-related transcriptional attenuator